VKIARLGARLLIGGLFVGHGTQKLKGWFGGPGLEGTQAMMDNLGMRPAKRNAVAAGVAETAGGAMLAAGLATPLAASVLTGTMLTAIQKVHAPNGVWVSGGGWEYNGVLIASALAIAEGGPGVLSLDHVLGIEKKGAGWALLAAAVGAAAAYATMQLGSRSAPDPAAPDDEPSVDGDTSDLSLADAHP
jgi:putative oxidoreductase